MYVCSYVAKITQVRCIHVYVQYLRANQWSNYRVVAKAWFTIWRWSLRCVTSVKNARVERGSTLAFLNAVGLLERFWMLTTLHKLQHHIGNQAWHYWRYASSSIIIGNQAWHYWHCTSSSVILGTRLDTTDTTQAQASYWEPGLTLLTLRKLQRHILWSEYMHYIQVPIAHVQLREGSANCRVSLMYSSLSGEVSTHTHSLTRSLLPTDVRSSLSEWHSSTDSPGNLTFSSRISCMNPAPPTCMYGTYVIELLSIT